MEPTTIPTLGQTVIFEAVLPRGCKRLQPEEPSGTDGSRAKCQKIGHLLSYQNRNREAEAGATDSSREVSFKLAHASQTPSLVSPAHLSFPVLKYSPYDSRVSLLYSSDLVGSIQRTEPRAESSSQASVVTDSQPSSSTSTRSEPSSSSSFPPGSRSLTAPTLLEPAQRASLIQQESELEKLVSKGIDDLTKEIVGLIKKGVLPKPDKCMEIVPATFNLLKGKDESEKGRALRRVFENSILINEKLFIKPYEGGPLYLSEVCVKKKTALELKKLYNVDYGPVLILAGLERAIESNMKMLVPPWVEEARRDDKPMQLLALKNFCKDKAKLKKSIEKINKTAFKVLAYRIIKGRAFTRRGLINSIRWDAIRERRKKPPKEHWNNQRDRMVRTRCALDATVAKGTAMSTKNILHKFDRDRVVGNFPPNAAIAFIHQLQTLKWLDKKVSWLDPCSGWGDRLTAALVYSKVIHYTGIDPNASLQDGYEEIKDYITKSYDQEEVGTTTELIVDCAENVTWREEKFNFVFTSPPYFDREIYSEDALQSCNNYMSYEIWKNNFLGQMMKNAWGGLKDDGVFAINIKDTKDYSIAQDAKKLGNKLPGAVFKGEWQLVLGGGNKESEPILVWKKR